MIVPQSFKKASLSSGITSRYDGENEMKKETFMDLSPSLAYPSRLGHTPVTKSDLRDCAFHETDRHHQADAWLEVDAIEYWSVS